MNCPVDAVSIIGHMAILHQQASRYICFVASSYPAVRNVGRVFTWETLYSVPNDGNVLKCKDEATFRLGEKPDSHSR